jgi:hypothetical protein
MRSAASNSAQQPTKENNDERYSGYPSVSPVAEKEVDQRHNAGAKPDKRDAYKP